MSKTVNLKTYMELARQEFAAVLALKRASDISDRIFGFHAQQVVEFSLRTWLAILQAEYPQTFSVNVLFAVLEDEIGSEEISAYRHLEMLTPYAVQFRYSAYDDNNHELDRDKIALDLKKLLDNVSTLIDESEDQ